jgi:multiple sugar transport system permease protein
MVEGLMTRLHARISDTARSAAVKAELTRANQDSSAVPLSSDMALVNQLSPEAIGAGVDTILGDVERLTDDRLLAQVFDGCYRRVCLGDVRVRGAGYAVRSLNANGRWRAESKAAQLITQSDGTGSAQCAAIGYGDKPVSFIFSSEMLSEETREMDRLFVQYRGDESWASVVFEVVRDGVLYRTDEVQHLFERTWAEQELRWPGDENSWTERRVYGTLHTVGPAPFDAPALLVRVRLERNRPLTAWAAKIARNYRQTFREVPYARYLMTSVSLVLLNVVLALFACTLVGYAFARLHWPGRDFCFILLLATMMMPPQVTMIPGFLIMKSIGWFNTLKPLWVPAAFGAPFFIFLVRQFLKGVPGDLEDAARVDGCGFLRIYWHVMLPLVKPTLATIAIFSFVASWNNFMGPLIFVNDERLFPLALGLFKFSLHHSGDIGLMMAGSLVMTLPVVALFFFLQRYFIQGISLTGTKE